MPLPRGSGGSGVPSGRGGQELCSLLGPSPLPPHNFGSEQHQTRPSPFSRGLRVSALLCASCLFQYCPVEVCRCPLGGARGDTKVVSMASCAPCQSVNPSATTSSLCPSSTLASSRSTSLTKVLVLAQAPASLHTCAAALVTTSAGV